MNPASAGFWVVGAIVIVVGLLGASGLVSISTAVPCGSACTLTGGGIEAIFPVASFSYSAVGENVSITLANTVPTNPVSVASSFSWSSVVFWGDGTSTPLKANGGANHTYAVSSVTVSDTLCGRGGAVIQSPNSTAISTCVTASVAISIPPSGTPAKGTVTSTSSSGNAVVAPSFKSATSGLVATFTDTSVATNETIETVVFAFGDGSVSQALGAGMSSSHTYASAGRYSVRETVTGGAVSLVKSSSGSTLVPTNYTVSGNVTVAPTSNTATSILSGLGVSSAAPGFNPSVIGLLVFGTVLVLSGFVAIVRLDIAAVLTVLGLIAAAVVVFVPI